jgi:hypothetical protein
MDELLEELKPVCIYNENNSKVYRNQELLKEILKKHVPTLL